MPEKIAKTNAMRALDARRFAYEVHSYSPEIHSADVVASTLGLPASQVYKTLVILRGQGRPLLVMVAGDREVDMRLLARSLGEKRVAMASKNEAERLTGLQVGGIGALALLNRGFEVCIDRPALDEERILVNGGQRGLNLGVRVADLIRVTGARVVDATAEPTEDAGD